MQVAQSPLSACADAEVTPACLHADSGATGIGGMSVWWFDAKLFVC